MLLILIPTYLVAVCSQPGRLKKHYDFIWLVDKLLAKGLHLDNVCVYDEVLKSETSFHCQICNSCVELFDHHCPYINNCLGARNHKYFLVFLIGYSLFLLSILLEVTRHLVDLAHQQTANLDLWISPLFLLLIILLNLPILGFQLYA